MSGPGGPPNNFGQGFAPGYGANNAQQRPARPRFNFKQKTSTGRNVSTPDLMAQQLASFGAAAKQKPAMGVPQQQGFPTQQGFPANQGMYQANTMPANQQMYQQQMFQQQQMYQAQQQRYQSPQAMPYGQGFAQQQYGQSFQPATFGNQPMRNPGQAARKGSVGSIGALGTPQPAVGLPPTSANAFVTPQAAVGLPPSNAFGNSPQSAVGLPQSAVGLPPSAVGLPPSASAMGNLPSAFGSQPAAMGLPPTSSQNNFSAFGAANFGNNQTSNTQNFGMNQNTMNFSNMSMTPSPKPATFNQPPNASFATPQPSSGGLSGDMFDMFSSGRAQPKPQPAVAAEEDPFLSLRNRKGSSNSIGSNGSSKPDMFGSKPFAPPASTPSSVFSSFATPTPSAQTFNSFSTPATPASQTFNSFPATFNSAPNPASIKSGTLSSDLFVSAPSATSGFDMAPFNPTAAAPQGKPTDLFGSAPFVPATATPAKPASDPFGVSSAPAVDMFGSAPFSAQSDKFSAFDSLSSTPAAAAPTFSAFDTPSSAAPFSAPTPFSTSTPTVEDKFSAFSSLSLSSAPVTAAPTSTFTFSEPPPATDNFAFSQPATSTNFTAFSQPAPEPANNFAAFGSTQPAAQLDTFAAFSAPQPVSQASDSFAAFRSTATPPAANDKYSVFSDLTSEEPSFGEPAFEPMFDSLSTGGTFPPTAQLQKLPGQLSKPPLPPKRPASGPSVEPFAASSPFSLTPFATPSAAPFSAPAPFSATPPPFPTSTSPFASTSTGNDLFDQSLLSGITTAPPAASAAIDLSIFDPAPKPAPAATFDQAPFDPFGAGSFTPDASSPFAAPSDNVGAFSAAFDSPAFEPEAAFDPFATQATVSTTSAVDGRSRPTPAKKSSLLLLPPPAKPAPRGTAPKLPPKRDTPKKPASVKPPQPPRSYDGGKKVPPKPPVRPKTKRQAPPPPSRPSTVKVPVSAAPSVDLLSDLFSPTSTPGPTPSVNLLDDDLEIAPPLPKREIKSQPLLIMPTGDPRTAAPVVLAPPARPSSSPAVEDKYAAFSEAAPPLPPRPTPGHQLYHYIAATGPHCVANFTFEAEDSEELEFKAGDVIVLVSEISDEWFEGSVKGKTGMFPKNLVTVKTPLAGSSSEPVFSPNPSFDTPNPPFDTPATPEQAKPKQDIFNAWDDAGPPSPPSTPSSTSSSEHRQSHAESPASEATVLQSCVVLYDFEGAEEDELSITEGQTVQVTEFISEDWAKGRCDGKEGIFPLGYVDLGTDKETFEPFLSDAEEESEELPPRPTFDELPPRPTFEELKSPSPDEPTTDESPELSRPDNSGHPLVHRADSLLLPSSESLSVPSTEERHVLYAEYDFVPEADDELLLHVGQEVEIVAMVDSEWLRGRAGDNEGIFPAGFVPPIPAEWNLPSVAQYLESLESDVDTMSLTSDVTSIVSEVETSSLDESILGKGQAILDFETENDFELALTKGDMVTVTGRLTETWLEGECNGATGIFPAEFIQWTEGGEAEEFLSNPCVAEAIPHKVFEREQTLTNFDNEATPTKHNTLCEEVTPRPEQGEEELPSFSSSNPFAELEAPSVSIEDRYSMLKPDNPQYGAEPDVYTALAEPDVYAALAEPDVYASLDSGLFTNKENPFTPTTGRDADPFTEVAAEDPFTQPAESDPFSKDPFSATTEEDPFAKTEDPFIEKEDPFQSTAEDPFKASEDPFAKDTADPFADIKAESDPFNNGKTEDPFSSGHSEDPFSTPAQDPFSGSQLFTQAEDPFSAAPGAKASLYSMRALYAFEPDNEDELAFTEGDVIEIVEEVNEEWLIGQCKGNEGLFPAAFAERT